MTRQESRQSLLAKIHIAKKDLNLPEDVYRAMVVNVTGKDSCADASYNALVAMVAEMRAKGWKGQPDSWLNYNASPKFSEECKKLGGKIRAILLDTDKSWNYAHGIAQKSCGKKLEKCTVPELMRVVGLLSNASRGRGKIAMEKAKAENGGEITGNTVKNAVLSYWRFQRQCAYVATEVWDCDVIASDGKKLVEIEVKISWHDFQRDFAKAKTQKPHCPNHKYFAAPKALAHRIAEDERVINGGYGVIAMADTGQISVIKRAKLAHSYMVTPSALRDIVARLTSELITMREQVRA